MSDHYDELYRQALEKQALRHTRKASRVIFARRTQCLFSYGDVGVTYILSVERFLVSNTKDLNLRYRNLLHASLFFFFFFFFPTSLERDAIFRSVSCRTN